MKTKFYVASALCAASLAFCLPLNAQLTPAATASPAASPATAAKTATQETPFRGKISAVDQTAKTFTVGGKKKGSRTLKVTDSTTITKGTAAATMTDIVVNEHVRGTCLKQADGTFEAKTVNIGAPTAGGKKAGKGKKGAAAASPTP